MPREIGGTTYYTLTEATGVLGRSRTTICRWLKSGSIPRGRKYRNLERLFTKEELEAIRRYSVRMEEGEGENVGQLPLFTARKQEG